MKLGSETKAVERGGDQGKDRKFRIAATGKAFEILSSGLYKDHISAICRELGANAADSHIMAGKRDARFTVHLPTAFEPYFFVADQGVGLSDEQVAYFYTTYFASDKTNTNDVTGCLGLGSKSPFSYTSSFTVTSVTNGMRRIYTAFKEDGEPNITRMSEEPTTEPNGVEVRFGVNKEHYDEFRTKSLAVYRWFTPRPVILGMPDDDYEEEDEILRRENWALRMDRTQHTSVIMGNVHYRVDKEQLGAKFIGKLNLVEQSLLECGPIFNVAIGDCDITASRESLKFSDKTYASIRKCLGDMLKSIDTNIRADVAAAPTLWDARLLINNLNQSYWLGKYLETTPILWNGVPVKSSIRIKNKDSYGSINCRAFIYESSHVRRLGKKWRITRSEPEVLHVTPETEIYTLDTMKSCVSRVMYYLGKVPEGTKKMIYLIGPGANEADYDLFIEQNQLGHVLKGVSTLPEVPREYVERRKPAQVLTVSPYRQHQRPQDAWNPATIDLEADTGVFVHVKGHEWAAGVLGSSMNPVSLINLFTELKPLLGGMGADDVIGVRRQLANKFIDNDNWVRLDEFLKNIVHVRRDLRRTVALQRLWGALGGGNSISVTLYDLVQMSEEPTISHTSPLRKVGKMLADIYKQTNSPEARAYEHLLKWFPAPIPEFKKRQKAIEELLVKCEERYELLHVAKGFHHSKPKIREHFLLYTKAVDRQSRRISNSIEVTPPPAAVTNKKKAQGRKKALVTA